MNLYLLADIGFVFEFDSLVQVLKDRASEHPFEGSFQHFGDVAVVGLGVLVDALQGHQGFIVLVSKEELEQLHDVRVVPDLPQLLDPFYQRPHGGVPP